MEPFEKHIKKQLQNRTLRPSDNAWHRVEQMLNPKPPLKKRKNGYTWWMAAGIILFIGLWFIQEQKTTGIETVIPKTIVEQDTFAPLQKVHTNSQSLVVITPDAKPKPQIEKKKKTSATKEINRLSHTPADLREKIIVSTEENEKASEKKEIAMIPAVTVKQIEVNSSKLLRSAEMERQMDNSYTGGQNFWKNLKRINTVAENTK